MCEWIAQYRFSCVSHLSRNLFIQSYIWPKLVFWLSRQLILLPVVFIVIAMHILLVFIGYFKYDFFFNFCLYKETCLFFSYTFRRLKTGLNWSNCSFSGALPAFPLYCRSKQMMDKFVLSSS